MIQKIFVAIIVLVAVIAGICAMALPREEIARLIMFRDFFDMALPILAFGALVKYLVSCCHSGSCGKCSCPPGQCNCGKGKCCCPPGRCTCKKDVIV